MATSLTRRTKVFISYSHRDSRLFKEFLGQLGALQQRGLLEVWEDTRIEAGAHWREEIDQGLASAKVAILLVSPAFLNSKFITTVEVPHLLKATQQEDVTLLPIILKNCPYNDTELGPLQAVSPTMSKPVQKMNPAERADLWVKVVELIKRGLHTEGQAAHTTSATDIQNAGKELSRDAVVVSPTDASRTSTEDISEKGKRLRVMFADHSSFMRNRRESFVGRQTELAQIRQLIQEKMPTGGYVTITGQAGQGKSSIIAQLVQKQNAEKGSQEQGIYHFIPFNPGLDHQVGLLRNLIARLMFKYDLSDLYIEYVAYGNHPALRDFFPRVLQEIADKGVQEVIFIDGLDQLEEDFNGLRDLTFLPANPPPGIVFVLGTRPNDTLHPLELLTPHAQYTLPNLSRFDFELILQHHGACLSPDITDQFYHTMQENALFLNLVAKELTAAGATITPDEMIKKLTNNPANLFSFALKRLEQSPKWKIIEQVLGILLVSREPLSFQQIRQMIGIKDRQLHNTLASLGGLITESAPKEQPEHRRYSLFHLMFKDFLGQNEHERQNDSLFSTSEVEHYHSIVANWCEGEQLALIWQDTRVQVDQERKVYARQHYITHLYLAKEWQQLFGVLDKGSYGRAKVQHDPSMHSYTLDLELGRLASASHNWSLEQGLEHLSFLWRYTLLQCSLASRADKYSKEAFEFLLLLRQEAKAIGLAELLTDPSHKAPILLQIANHLAKQPDRKVENDQLFTRTNEVATMIENTYRRGQVLSSLGLALAHAGLWERAEAVWMETEVTIGQIKYGFLRRLALRSLAQALAQAGQWEYAEATIGQIEDANVRDDALSSLSQNLAQAGQWECAEATIGQIKYTYWRGYALSKLGEDLAHAGLWERAEAVWREAEATIGQIEDAITRKLALSLLIKVLSKMNKHEQGLAMIQHSWLQATTRFEALNLLDIVSPFITLKPELGIALIEAFSWVDKFLKG